MYNNKVVVNKLIKIRTYAAHGNTRAKSKMSYKFDTGLNTSDRTIKFKTFIDWSDVGWWHQKNHASSNGDLVRSFYRLA